MKIKIGWLFVTVLMLTSCGGIRSVRTAKTTAKADGASLMKETLLSAEQQRKYDYFFLEAMRMKGKNEYDAAFGLLQHCLDINPTASLRFMKYRNIICSFARCRKVRLLWSRQWLLRLITIGIVRDWSVCTSNKMNWIRLRLCLRRW